MKWNPPESGKVILNWGIGLDSTAILLKMAELDVRPDAIIFSDTGSEWPHTYQYCDDVALAWMEREGFPQATLIDRNTSGIKVRRLETLYERSIRTETLPSAAYGRHSCSLKFKAEAMNAWWRHTDWCKDEWEAGRRIIKIIGYESNERGRAYPRRQCHICGEFIKRGHPLCPNGHERLVEFVDGREAREFVPYYPLIEWGLTRDDLPGIFKRHGLKAPRKSACWFCPMNQDHEWLELKKENPLLFNAALKMEDLAMPKIRKPRDIGLRRRGKPGERQLRAWSEALDKEQGDNDMTVKTEALDLINPQGVTVSEVVSKTGRPAPSIRRTMNALVKEGLLRKEDGRYLPPDQPQATEPVVTCDREAFEGTSGDTEKADDPNWRDKLLPRSEPEDLDKVEPVEETAPDGIPYRLRSKPCKTCGGEGYHHCCAKCGESATGIEQMEEVFGFRKLNSKTGPYRTNQPQCRSCRKAAAVKANAKAKAARLGRVA